MNTPYAPPAASELEDPKAAPATHGFWLYVFVAETIAFALLMLFCVYSSTVRLGPRDPGNWIFTFFCSGLFALALLTVIALIRQHKLAPRLAFWLLFATPVLCIATIMTIPFGERAYLWVAFIIHAKYIIGIIIHSLLWMLYFRFSRRVKALFPRNTP